VTALPWWLAGTLVGTVAVTYPLVTGRLVGVSGNYEQLLDLFRRRRAPAPDDEQMLRAMVAATEAQFGQQALPPTVSPSAASVKEAAEDSADDTIGRALFLLGIVAGGLLVQLRAGFPAAAWSLGNEFDVRFHGLGLAVGPLFAGCGVLIGVGTRLAGGCTSGHGISGVACGQRGSLLSAAIFWGVGLLTAQLAYLVLT
jgi:hypothetical protein